MFIGCSKESEPVNGTTEPTSVETVDEIVDNFTEEVSIEDTTTDENGNEVLVGKDKDGNTVEIKTDSNGNVTKTVTDKDTGKKTEQTTTVTTKKQETTTKKKSEETTKKPETTTKKPASQTTSAHTHNFVKKSKQILVKEAWDEDIYETKQKMEEMQTFYCCGCHVDCREEARKLGYNNYQEFHVKHSMGMDGLSCPHTYDNGYSMLIGQAIGQPNRKMYPVYENGKPVYEKIKTGTKHHDAEYRTEYWEECACGAKR